MEISSTHTQKANVQAIAFWTAAVIHFFGLIGMLFFNRSWFVALTPLNLIIMSALLWLTHQNKSRSFYLFLLLCWFTGMAVEIIGVKTGLLFGEYEYGSVFGISIAGVPVLIGMNWFAIVYSSATIAEKMIPDGSVKNRDSRKGKLYTGDFAFSITGAMLATFFDWVMEPVAVKLGYWEWKQDGDIPLYNYLCWFVVCIFLLLASRVMKLYIKNPFAVWLFVIQFIFFILLRLFLKP